MQRVLSHGILVLAALTLSVVTGVELYTCLVDMPLWFAQPPASFALWRAENQASAVFWMPAQLIIVITLLISLVLFWRTPRRRYIVVALVLFLLLFIAGGLYFLPQVQAFLRIPSDTPLPRDVAERIPLWFLLTWVRVAAFITAATFSLLALVTPLRQ